MPSHLLRRAAWGLVWRWSVLFASLILPAPPPAIVGTGILIVAGLALSIWRRHDWLGSAWRVLVAVAVVNLGFWLGSPMLVPAITLALGITVLDLWWSLTPGREAATDEARLTVIPDVPEPILHLSSAPLAVIAPGVRRRRASRREAAAGLRVLVAACLVVTAVTIGAFAMAAGASGGVATALASIGQRLGQITPAAPGSTTPSASPEKPSTPAHTPADSPTAVAPNGGDGQPPLDTAPRIDVSRLCFSLPDHRYALQLPNGQMVVVTTHHRDGCPDLASILKLLQRSGDNSN